jgi:hypothetical protein
MKQMKFPNGLSGIYLIISKKIVSIATDYYLWLTGQAVCRFHGESSFSTQKPLR